MKPFQKRKHQTVQHESQEYVAAASMPRVRFTWSALASAMVPGCPRRSDDNFPRIIEVAEHFRAGRHHVTPESNLRDWLDAQQECEPAGTC